MRCAAENVLLSPREIEIAVLLRRGLKDREIARALGVQHQTVRQHLGKLYRGLNLGGRVELAMWCEQHPTALRGEWCESPPGFRPRSERLLRQESPPGFRPRSERLLRQAARRPGSQGRLKPSTPDRSRASSRLTSSRHKPPRPG